MKIIAFYLPQFHQIPENDEWWGKGFTEWTNTTKATPLFKGHHQPREPYNDNYYNLLNPEVRKWQANLAKKYGIYGFCYYHYWFKGKQLLEKPLDEVIRLQEPDMPFCVSWANEPWTRSWDGGTKKIIMPQDYGNEKDWAEHFNYLLTLFKDRRYIRINDKPLFVIYRSASIPRCDEMLEFWNTMALEAGLPGIYFVNTLTSFPVDYTSSNFEGQIEFEPWYTVVHSTSRLKKIVIKCKKLVSRLLTNTDFKYFFQYDYDDVWKCILDRRSQEKRTFLGAFVDWDNTARKGKQATIFSGASPDKFKKYLSQQIQKANIISSEYLFINAWNEWAEGTYLEPDKKDGYAYLEAVRQAIEENK